MNALLALPVELRLAGVFVLGLAAGSVVNWAIYSLAWFPRAISPWAGRHELAPPRRWTDRLPVVGWLGLSREQSVHGRWFWLRPPLVELALAAGLAGLYYWEVEKQGLVAPAPPMKPAALQAMLHTQFLAHAILIGLMTAATFIDFDEKTIPDSITIPGTLLALALSVGLPQSNLPVAFRWAPVLGNLSFASPDPFPTWPHSWQGPLLASLGLCAWCAALVPATATLRRGWLKAVQFYVASIARGGAWKWLLALAIAGCGAIWGVWLVGGPRWEALFTAVVGMVFGGGLIWAVRIVGTLALREEAMGFGDVTLMAMIGAFLGWQPALVVFFLSPAAALFVAVAQWVFTGRRDIAFGPYLCVAALYLIVRWKAVWTFAEGIFDMGPLVLAILAVCLTLMLGLLMLMRIIRQLLEG